MFEMNQSLADAFKQILQSLQVRFIFPAAFLVIANLLLFPQEVNWSDGFQIVVLCTLTVILSYLFNAFNGPIIRLVEGYIFRDNLVFGLTVFLERRKLKNYDKKIEHCENRLWDLAILKGNLRHNGPIAPQLQDLFAQIEAAWNRKRGKLIAERQLRFPLHNCLPTSFGNTIAAFENYPFSRYSMKAVTLWPRLLPILERKKYMPLVQNEKVVMDFLLNTSVVSVFVAVELLVFLNFYTLQKTYWPIAIALPVFTWLLYLATVAAAKEWGIMVCSAFDLYRDDLRQALHLPPIPDESLEEEKKLWRAISQFISHGETQDFKGFVYSKFTSI